MADTQSSQNPSAISAEIFPSRVGLWTSLDSVDVAEAQAITAELEDLGYGSLFFGEAYGREAFVNASLLLSATKKMVLATGIANIYARDPMAANAASRTLDSAFPNRFIMGLGVSHIPLVEKLRGHTYQSPIGTMSDYLDAIDGSAYFAKGLPERPRRVIAALGPKMLDLARDKADGAHPYLVTPEHTEMAREILGTDRLLLVEQAVVLGDDVEQFLARAHSHLEIYTGLANYRNNWKRLGFAEEDFVRGGSTKLKEALVAWGTADKILTRVKAHLDAGADHVCIQVLGSDASVPPIEDWRRLASAVVGL